MSSFCTAKATHIFSAKNIRILYIESAKTVNEMTLNELVKLTMLWTTGPGRTIYGLTGSGLHSHKGADPEHICTSSVGLRTWSCLTLGPKFKKHILSPPSTVADLAMYILNDAIPTEDPVRKKALILFGNVSRVSEYYWEAAGPSKAVS